MRRYICVRNDCDEAEHICQLSRRAPMASGGSITGGGASDSWASQKQTNKNKMDRFLSGAAENKITGVTSWDALPEEVVCRTVFYERFSFWLVRVYRISPGCINAGEPLSFGSVKGALGVALNRAKDKFVLSRTLETVLFLQCLSSGGTGESHVWLDKLKTRIERITFERSKAQGEKLDKSAGAPPVITYMSQYLTCVFVWSETTCMLLSVTCMSCRYSTGLPDAHLQYECGILQNRHTCGSLSQVYPALVGSRCGPLF